MEVLSNQKLSEISGGGKNLWIAIGAGIAFFIGVISGFMNPSACKK